MTYSIIVNRFIFFVYIFGILILTNVVINCPTEYGCFCPEYLYNKLICDTTSNDPFWFEKFRPTYFRTEFYNEIFITNKWIPSLSDEFLKNFSIKSLYLEYNQIEFISNMAFSQIKSLEMISLSRNKLNSIDNIFGPLKSSNLLSLKLKSNYLEILKKTLLLICLYWKLYV